MKYQIVEVREIEKNEAFEFITRFHYSKVLPRINKLFLGGFNANGELMGAMTLGWGVRPLHTIKKLFPSLVSQDYWEIGRMALDDECPRNSESQFLSMCFKHIKKNHPQIRLIFTWSDGMLGKPGYVYQASNFLYGGYSFTDTYFSAEGEKVHPRMVVSKRGGRPSFELMQELGWKHYKGKQFRYIYPLCNRREWRRLLEESTVSWGLEHPKHDDLLWKVKKADGWEVCEAPFYDTNQLSFYKSKRERVDNETSDSTLE